jgi:predicted secreted protein
VFSLLTAGTLALGTWAPVCVRAQDRTVALGENQNGATVNITKDQDLEIRLPVQGGTGFIWELVSAPSAPVHLTNKEIVRADGESRPGGPQAQLFMFKPSGTGSGDIELAYRRPWEQTTPPARTFLVHVMVREAAR